MGWHIFYSICSSREVKITALTTVRRSCLLHIFCLYSVGLYVCVLTFLIILINTSAASQSTTSVVLRLAVDSCCFFCFIKLVAGFPFLIRRSIKEEGVSCVDFFLVLWLMVCMMTKPLCCSDDFNSAG